MQAGILMRDPKYTQLMLGVPVSLEILQWEDLEVDLFMDIVMLIISQEWPFKKQNLFVLMLSP